MERVGEGEFSVVDIKGVERWSKDLGGIFMAGPGSAAGDCWRTLGFFTSLSLPHTFQALAECREKWFLLIFTFSNISNSDQVREE